MYFYKLFNKSFISIGVVLLPFFVWLQTAQSETLEDILISAYNNSELLKSTEYLVTIQDETINQTSALARPNLSLNLGANYRSYNDTTPPNRNDNSLLGSIELLATLIVYDFGANDIAVDIEEMRKQAFEINYTQTEQTVLLGAANSYQELLRANNLLELEKNNLKGLESQLEAAKNRFELGNISRTELSLVEARIAAAEGNVKTREGQLEIARELFLLSVGRYPESLSASQFNFNIPKDITSAMELASQHNPFLLQAKLLVLISQQQRELTKIRVSKPAINLRGTASSDLNLREFGDESYPQNNLTVGIQTTIPLYSGGRLSSALRQAELDLQKARIDLKHEAKLLENEIASAWHRLEIADSLIDVYVEQKDYSELALQGTRVEESLGTKSTLDVLEAEQELLSAQTSLVEALIDRDSAKFTLLSSIGVLTMDYLGLNPTIETEDTDPDSN